MTCETCKNGEYPIYGVAPHECYWRKGPEYQIGQSTLLPSEDWPLNFWLEVAAPLEPHEIQYPNACGVYFCPDCSWGIAHFTAPSDSNEWLYHPALQPKKPEWVKESI